MAANRFRILFLTIILVLILAVPASASSPEANLRVRIVDFAFRPRMIMGNVGDMVRWRNVGEAPHTTTSTTGEWDSGTLDPGETFTRTFNTAGTFFYLCEIHPSMTGKIVINP